MRKTKMLRLVFGALAGAAVLAGCDDQGRTWAMTAQDDYRVTSSTGALSEDTGTGGAGLEARVTPEALTPLVAQELGTGKPLRANAKGIWVQGTYAVELGSGIARSVAPESAPYQPQEQNINGNISTPHQRQSYTR